MIFPGDLSYRLSGNAAPRARGLRARLQNFTNVLMERGTIFTLEAYERMLK
jgi:hypothetical protein